MKAVAAALVLIAGAAVVLWYSNTLNSWVLGGLIGGLAALLLSIPISLTLFSFLSRRHDERLRTDQEEADAAFAQFHNSAVVPGRVVRSTGVYEEDEEQFLFEEDEWEAEERYRQRSAQRSLPAPSYPRLPAARQNQPSYKYSASQRGAYEPEATPRQQSARGKDGSTRRGAPRRSHYPGFPGYQQGSFRSQFQSRALREARQEAVQQYEDDVEVLPTHLSKRVPPTRSSRSLEDFYDQDREPRSPDQSSQSAPRQYPRYPRRRNTHASTTYNDSNTSFPEDDESTGMHSPRYQEPHTDYLHGDVNTENLGKPLVRRPPYVYEDDDLRQELAQYVEPPVTRRSSRNLSRRRNDE